MAGNWSLSGKTILVTGATGYVGRHLVARFAGSNQVLALQRHLPRKEQAVEGVRYLSGDVAEVGRVRLPARPDIIIHQAALLDNPIVGPEPPNSALFETNVRGTHYLLELALELKVPKFVYGSTSGFYGLGPEPFDEGSPLEPVNFYHLSKALCEQMCRWYGKQISMVTLRYSAPYGPGTSNPLLKFLIDQIRNGREVRCAADGAPKFNPVFIDDAVSITERACLLEGYHAIDVGGPEIISQIELVRHIAAAFGTKPALKIDQPATGQHLVIDVRKISELLEYEYTVPIAEGMRRMVAGS